MKEKFKSWAFSKEHGKCDVITLIIYLLGVCTVSFFHEPWFDEAQSWAIARSGTIKEILFEIPHYEGYPPLWHLILAPFAKLGAPYELSLAAVNIFFMTLAVAVLLFKSPFPKLIRCLLPFNFFLFYQYGVVSRPYCILVLAIFLAAACYKNRNEHPVKYLLCLALMCAVHSYGIIIAGCLCIVWLIEIFTEYKKSGKLADILKDRRCWLMFCLLIFAMLVMAAIVPDENVYLGGKMSSETEKKFDFSCINILFCFVIFSDSIITSFFNYAGVPSEIASQIPVIVVSILLVALFVTITYRNKKLLTFLLPYGVLSIFGSFVYISPYHIGVITAFVIFVLWIIVDESGKVLLPEYMNKISAKIGKKLKVIVKAIAFLPLLIPIAWSCTSSYFDIRYPYWFDEAADFIKEYHLDDYKIMGYWQQVLNGEIDDDAFWNVDEADYMWHDYPNLQGISVALNPYFDKNIFCYFNIDKHDKTFQYYRANTQKEAEEEFSKWREQGEPDVVIERCEITKAYPDIDVDNYVAVKRIYFYKPYKFETYDQYITIYVTKDLFNKIGTLEELTAKKLY
ncbi:MAG TPA: hypothetical protein DHU87_03200 [Ruminococcus sp.]|uniref:hypothetical protein n=1 Tax=Ruminococcus sp. TaxID=41978 RepID=UPI000EB8D056|nr:hypothetical protein [Ruminococcus sp.]HCY65555.1 hypothetical protein [Ruminococcus sp.]